MSEVVVGVDLGGTKIAAAVVSVDGNSEAVITVPTGAAEGRDIVLDRVAEAVRLAAGERGVRGVGVGTAGAVDAQRCRIVSSTETFPGWVGANLSNGLRARLGEVAVAVRNDVDAHLLGESWRGAAAGADSVVMVAAGTGIGGAVLLDGQLRTGVHHAAGEIGHIPTVGAEGLRCPCGRTGHLEALAAGPAIVRRYHLLGGTPTMRDTPAVVAAADRGDLLADRVITDAAAGLGRATAGIVTTVDPDIVVVGGGLVNAGARWWGAFERTLRGELIDTLAALPVVPASLGPTAAILGAALPLFIPAPGRSTS